MDSPPEGRSPYVGERALPSDLSAIAAVRRWVRERTRAYGLSPPEVHDVCLALTEALTNVVSHGYRDAPGDILVRLSLAEERVDIEVIDRGVPFVERASAPDTEPEPRVGGYGLLLMRRCMDEVRRGRTGDGANRLVMSRSLRHGTA